MYQHDFLFTSSWPLCQCIHSSWLWTYKLFTGDQDVLSGLDYQWLNWVNFVPISLNLWGQFPWQVKWTSALTVYQFFYCKFSFERLKYFINISTRPSWTFEPRPKWPIINFKIPSAIWGHLGLLQRALEMHVRLIYWDIYSISITKTRYLMFTKNNQALITPSLNCA